MHHTDGFELAMKQISLHFGAFAVLSILIPRQKM
jgi:hypothetical protein